MYYKFIYLMVIIKLAYSQYAPVANTLGNEEYNKETLPVPPLKTPKGLFPLYRRIQPYPLYQIVTPLKVHKPVEEIKTTTTSTTPAPHTIDGLPMGNTNYTPAEFPHELLEIAKQKLDLRSLDEVPSISELGEFLGTSNADETINYIRQLVNTEKGIALIKAYLESADYTDRTEEERRKKAQNKEILMPEESDAQKPKTNILERIAAYFHIYNLWPQKGAEGGNQKQVVDISKLLGPQLSRLQATNLQQRPQPAPYRYPIPLRPVIHGRRLPGAAQLPMHPVHLNTPKAFVSPFVQLARVVNIPPKQLEQLLQSKPKLAELAAKASHLPLSSEHAAMIKAQLMGAVQRAIEQDEDLKRLLSAQATLK